MVYDYPTDTLLFTLLLRHPEGLKEYDLLQQIKEEVPGLFDFTDIDRDLALFRSHFLLFHGLYRLQRRLLQEERFILHIHCLDIRLVPFSPGVADLEIYDPMAEYYLDLSNLAGVGEKEVHQMLEGFYKRLAAWWNREDDLALLDLEAGAGMDRVERRYRDLALKHHPDRGGDAERFRAIGEAVARLREAASFSAVNSSPRNDTSSEGDGAQ